MTPLLLNKLSRKSSIPKCPRHTRTIRKARDFIKETGVCWLPVNPFDIYKRYGWLIYSCSEAEKICKKPDPFRILENGIDARTFRERETGLYITIYNEFREVPERITWTLAHEIGHIVLGHLTDFELTLLNRGG
ncbi:MAG: hypothetical protein QHH75_12025, partial [Bacillota bacterium]|nr:hypothetical protein [Bacillota bacterium]